MKIVHMYDGHEKVHRGRGSVPDVVWNVAKHTAAKGHDVTIIERQWDELDLFEQQNGIGIRRVPLRTGSDEPWTQVPYEMITSPLGAVRFVVDRSNFTISVLPVLKRIDADVIHVHLPFAANVLVTIAPQFRTRMVYTAHLGETTERVVEPLFSPDVYLAKRTAGTIALNPDMRDAFLRRGVASDSVYVIPNGVQLETFKGISSEASMGIRTKYDLHGETTVLFVGTITPRKGVKELIKAANRVIEDQPEVEFVLTGHQDLEPAYVDEINETIEELNLASHITFTGFVSEDELPILYELADIFVLPSYEEGSSIAITEAMASGTPVVSSHIDGIKQQVTDGRHGYLVEPGDTTALAERISRLTKNPTERQEMSEAIAERAKELSWNRVVNDIIRVYEKVGTG